MFLLRPSSFFDISTSFFTLGSFCSSFLIRGSWAKTFSKDSGREGSKGIILQSLSTYPYGKPKTLPISLKAIRAFNFPNVIIWATPLPYFCFKYSKTLSLFSSQKSISKSGIEIRSGFKNLSKIKSNLIGSISVMERDQATNEPAPEPRPGPTGMLLFFAHFI